VLANFAPDRLQRHSLRQAILQKPLLHGEMMPSGSDGRSERLFASRRPLARQPRLSDPGGDRRANFAPTGARFARIFGGDWREGDGRRGLSARRGPWS
jgi:hypothetical protein